MRARMAIAAAGIRVELREVVLRNKPEQMLAISPKGTVPVLQADEGVLEESLDIMIWALNQNDPRNWLAGKRELSPEMAELIEANDHQFKPWLDRYKYADRYPEFSAEQYRSRAELFLGKLEDCLQDSPFLLGGYCSIADVAIFPFIRQFANVDKSWFLAAPYPGLQHWLDQFLDSELFGRVMTRFDPWLAGRAPVYWGEAA